MEISTRKLPIGVQSFEKLREEGCLYVDKTEYVYRLTQTSTPYFLSRPRRFGKSLFLSTLKAYFEGKRELFRGLAIEELTWDDPDAWQEYPVFYIDFNRTNFKADSALEQVLEAHLNEWEKVYGNEYTDRPLAERFQHLIVAARKQTGRNVVVLVDEYDKPLLEGADVAMIEHNKNVFKGFFSTLKSFDQYIRFVFITGVTKFSKVSIFSDLNQLNDISLDDEYSAICGITETELKDNFAPEIDALSQKMGVDVAKCLSELKRMYDGYHFSGESDGVYNPFSILNALSKRKLGMYWFSTGTPTFLIDKLKESDLDPKCITDGELYADENVLTDYTYDGLNPVPLFYQTGYLTIKDYDSKYLSYQLDYPNDEVKYGFLDSLAPMMLQNEGSSSPVDIRAFGKDIEAGNTDGIRDRLTALFARLPYPSDEKIIEQNFQNVIYIVFMLLGQFVMTEVHSSKGRADCIVETDDYVYIFEFKRDRSAAEALQQIEDSGYAKPYAADKRELIRIGANFNSKERSIDDWEALSIES